MSRTVSCAARNTARRKTAARLPRLHCRVSMRFECTKSIDRKTSCTACAFHRLRTCGTLTVGTIRPVAASTSPSTLSAPTICLTNVASAALPSLVSMSYGFSVEPAPVALRSPLREAPRRARRCAAAAAKRCSPTPGQAVTLPECHSTQTVDSEKMSRAKRCSHAPGQAERRCECLADCDCRSQPKPMTPESQARLLQDLHRRQ